MRSKFIEANSFIKGFILFLRPGAVLGFLSGPFIFAGNVLRLTRWVARQRRREILNDFYIPFRNYTKRFELYRYLIAKEEIGSRPIDYLEFGVSTGLSFKWWLDENRHPDSRFYGFDTFEGLPEDWGLYKKGEMAGELPIAAEPRAEFVKGLFQDSLFGFLATHPLGDKSRRKVIHMDADLFSSTLFVLTTIAQYLNDGDIIMFDEFNVPNHEFYAFQCFTESYYIKTELIGAVNNYYQVAFRIVK